MVIGFNPDAENPVMVASNMDRAAALEIIKSLKSALEVVDAEWKLTSQCRVNQYPQARPRFTSFYTGKKVFNKRLKRTVDETRVQSL